MTQCNLNTYMTNSFRIFKCTDGILKASCSISQRFHGNKHEGKFHTFFRKLLISFIFQSNKLKPSVSLFLMLFERSSDNKYEVTSKVATHFKHIEITSFHTLLKNLMFLSPQSIFRYDKTSLAAFFPKEIRIVVLVILILFLICLAMTQKKNLYHKTNLNSNKEHFTKIHIFKTTPKKTIDSQDLNQNPSFEIQSTPNTNRTLYKKKHCRNPPV